MRVGMLTGGGDCPGLNAVIRAVVRKGVGDYQWEMVGFRKGWQGLVKRESVSLGLAATNGILHVGGTILGTSRTNPYKLEGGVEAVLTTLGELGVDALVAIGGDDTLGVAKRLYEDHGMPVVGVPKTIDNDLSGTDYTFGFDTAVAIATDAIDRLHTTAESHHRVMVAEVMGRHAGWIAIMSGIAGGADVIMVPEFPLTMEDVCDRIEHRALMGKDFAVVVVSEGAEVCWRSGQQQAVSASDEVDAFGHVKLGGVGGLVAREIKRITGRETRETILGYIQRGGSPTARDRVLGTRFGVKAAEMVQAGEWGMMAGLKGDHIEAVPLSVAVGSCKTVSEDWWDLAKVFFG
jgi:ATP-dependent phosphofructokinase / diphosphate-dependent phosphofructokinase